MPSISTLETVEEIGPRLRQVRLQRNLSVNRVANLAEIGSSSVTAAEGSCGSVRSLQKVAEALNLELEITARDDSGVTTNVPLEKLQAYIARARADREWSPSEMARRAGVRSSAVIKFEDCERPTLQSITRYLDALNITLSIRILENGKALSFNAVATPATSKGRKSSDAAGYFAPALAAGLKKSREASGLTRYAAAKNANVSYTAVGHAEDGRTSLPAAGAIAAASGHRLVITMTDANGTVLETDPDRAPAALNGLREAMKIPYAEMARRMGSTYRTAVVFGQGTLNPLNTIERYASALGFTLGFRLERLSR